MLWATLPAAIRLVQLVWWEHAQHYWHWRSGVFHPAPGHYSYLQQVVWDAECIDQVQCEAPIVCHQGCVHAMHALAQ
jgi:hypothetical protein